MNRRDGPGWTANQREETSVNQRRTYEEVCREAATSQGLDPIKERLAGEGIPYRVEQTGGFVMLIRIPLAGPAWIGVTASDEHPDGAWSIALYHDDADEGTLLSWKGSYDWPADAAVATIREHVALARHEATGEARRLVNAYVVYGYPDGQGGTYTVLGSGAWGRPTEAFDHAQRQRDAYHERLGATPLTDAPWRRESSYGGLPARYHPPGAAVGVEIRDVRTGERWFVPTVGAPLGPIGPRMSAAPRWQPRPPGIGVIAGEPAVRSAAHHAALPLPQRVNDLQQRLDSLAGADPPDVGL